MASSKVSSEDVVSAFEDLGQDLDQPKVIDLICSLCDIYKVDADRISTELLAFTMKKKMDVSEPPSLELLEGFENEILKKLEQRKAKNQERGIVDVTNLLEDVENDDNDDEDDTLMSYGKVKRQMTPDNSHIRKKMLGDLDGGPVPFSPTSYKAESTPNSRKYRGRTNAGQPVITFGDGKVSDWKRKDEESFDASIKHQGEALESSYRFMFEGMPEKAGYLDEAICRVGESLTEKFGLEESQDFTQTIPDPIVGLGRICCDSSEGRLNAHSIVLQGSQDLCNGRTAPMDPTRVQEYSLFPGQIIQADCINPNGSKVLASKIYSDAAPELPSKPDRLNSEPLSVVVSSGPYTTSDNLGYEPLSDFMKYVATHKPHVVLMTGPFVDAKHQNIESGEADETFEKIFDRLLTTIADAVKDLKVQVVLVPSSRDVQHVNVYPQPPFSRQLLSGEELPENVLMASDPCTLNIEGVVFGVTSTDILFHLGKEEISFPPRSGDRLRRLASHVLQQRSFYPLYPAGEDLNVDYERLEKYAQMGEQPHVLVLPSDLLHFFKDVNGGLIVNPSRLTKREGGGVFARMLIEPAKEEGQVFAKRVKGEIVKI